MLFCVPSTRRFSAACDSAARRHALSTGSLDVLGHANGVIAAMLVNIGQPRGSGLLGQRTYNSGSVYASPSIGCPGGQPSSPASEIQLTGSEVVATEVPGGTGFDVTARLDGRTLGSVPASYQGLECTFDLDTSRGSVPSATAHMTLTHTPSPTSPGGYRLDPGGMTIDGLEAADVNISGYFACAA